MRVQEKEVKVSMSRDVNLICEAYAMMNENVAQSAAKLINTIKGWTWEANKPSPQTKKMYPGNGVFHNRQTAVKVSDMLDNAGKVKPEWKQDFNNSVVKWLFDLVGMQHPGVNKLKDSLNIEDDINPHNQQMYQQQVSQIVNYIAPQTAPAPNRPIQFIKTQPHLRT